MAELSYRAKKSLPKAVFGLPSQKKYPMPDKAHAINAKARAQQQYEKGNLSRYELLKIERMANKIIKREGGKAMPAGTSRSSNKK